MGSERLLERLAELERVLPGKRLEQQRIEPDRIGEAQRANLQALTVTRLDDAHMNGGELVRDGDPAGEIVVA
jgi:hypothetical protein